MNVCELEGVVKVFDSGHRALDGLSMSVPRGSIFGFLGMNGAGKTTTIRIIAGLLRADGGRIRLFDRDFVPEDPEHLRQMGFVLDEPLYFDWMTVREYWEFVGGMYTVERSQIARRVGELLEFFDLEAKREEPIATYSTGMKKKVSLGASLIHRPRFLLLDEPLEGIDALAANSVKEALREASRQGTTVLITSHALDAMERLCTEIGILHEGRLAVRAPAGGFRELPAPPGTPPFQTLEELFVSVVGRGIAPNRLRFLHDDESR